MIQRLLNKNSAILLLAFTCTSFCFTSRQKHTAGNKEFVNSIFQAIHNVKTLRYNLKCTERVNGKLQHTESSVKLQVAPRKLYLHIKGIEVLWIDGENKNEALVNPGSFPYVNLNLDPEGVIMRKDQHHTIHEMGYHYLESILMEGYRKVGDKLDKYFTIVGEDNHNGRDCYQLSITSPEFTWTTYTVKKGETMISIARKLFVSEYMILENNPKLGNFRDVKAGQIIKVPTTYAKLTLLMIDKETLLPISNKVFDDKGLFEMYEYFDVKVNTPIAPEEFTRNYKDYKF
jgi:outer membrane lipoprotein-sorting protein